MPLRSLEAIESEVELQQRLIVTFLTVMQMLLARQQEAARERDRIVRRRGRDRRLHGPRGHAPFDDNDDEDSWNSDSEPDCAALSDNRGPPPPPAPGAGQEKRKRDQTSEVD